MKYGRKGAREAEFTQSTASTGQMGVPGDPSGCTETPWLPWSPAAVDGQGHRPARFLRALPLLGQRRQSAPNRCGPCPVPLTWCLTPNRWGGTETHPSGLTGQQEGLSCDERKNFLQGKAIKPWNELLREAEEAASWL